MKNFPDKFPIRYAIIVQHDHECRPFYGLSKEPDVIDDDIMLQQLLEFLREKPVLKEDLKINGYQMKSPDLPNRFGQYQIMINKLITNQNYRAEIISDLFSSSISRQSSQMVSGPFYELILLSYAGNLEIPWFWKIRNSSVDKLKHYRYKIPESEFYSPVEAYKKVFSGEEKESWLFDRMQGDREVYTLTIPYSDLWKKIDDSKTDGIFWAEKKYGAQRIIRKERCEKEYIELTDQEQDYLASPVNKFKIYEEIASEFVQKEVELSERRRNEIERFNGKKIKVTVTRSWDALFYKEISELYQLANYCNNCGKPLPFDYKGIFCPPLVENSGCAKKRARDRKHRSQK